MTARTPGRLPLSTMLGTYSAPPEDPLPDRRPARHRAPGPASSGDALLLPLRVSVVDLPAALRAARRPGGADPAPS